VGPSQIGCGLKQRLAGPPPREWRRPPPALRPRVLFLCTSNSARSQIAEALIEKLTGGAVDAYSAGSRTKPLNPNAVRVMRERGIDIAGRRSKHLDEFAGERFDYVVSLCDRVREVCPAFPDHPGLVHWSIPDRPRGLDRRRDFPRVRAHRRRACCADPLPARTDRTGHTIEEVS
jgi:protein-tyrosine-phosphatase